MRAVPDQIARWVPGDYTSLGTDGFGRSDTRAALRRLLPRRRRVDRGRGAQPSSPRRGEVKQETLQQAVDGYQLTEVAAAGAGNTGGDS